MEPNDTWAELAHTLAQDLPATGPVSPLERARHLRDWQRAQIQCAGYRRPHPPPDNPGEAARDLHGMLTDTRRQLGLMNAARDN